MNENKIGKKTLVNNKGGSVSDYEQIFTCKRSYAVVGPCTTVWDYFHSGKGLGRPTCQ